MARLQLCSHLSQLHDPRLTSILRWKACLLPPASRSAASVLSSNRMRPSHTCISWNVLSDTVATRAADLVAGRTCPSRPLISRRTCNVRHFVSARSSNSFREWGKAAMQC